MSILASPRFSGMVMETYQQRNYRKQKKDDPDFVTKTRIILKPFFKDGFNDMAAKDNPKNYVSIKGSKHFVGPDTLLVYDENPDSVKAFGVKTINVKDAVIQEIVGKMTERISTKSGHFLSNLFSGNGPIGESEFRSKVQAILDQLGKSVYSYEKVTDKKGRDGNVVGQDRKTIKAQIDTQPFIEALNLNQFYQLKSYFSHGVHGISSLTEQETRRIKKRNHTTTTNPKPVL